MLNCKQVVDLASKSLDDSVSWQQHWRMKLHLMMCSNCRRYIKQLKFLQKVVLTMDGQNSKIALSAQAKERIRNAFAATHIAKK